jgi:hypothetical protein
MEALMEQLILLNAPPSLRATYIKDTATADQAGRDPDELPSQIEELRAQINDKNKKVEEDAATLAELREEIAILQTALVQQQQQQQIQSQPLALATPQLAQSWPLLDRTRQNEGEIPLGGNEKQRKPRLSMIRNIGHFPKRKKEEVFGPTSQSPHQRQQQGDNENTRSILRRSLVKDLASLAAATRIGVGTLNLRTPKAPPTNRLRSVLRKDSEDSEEFL